MDGRLHLLISGDRRVMPGLEALVYSTMKHNRNVVWHLFTMEVQINHGDGTGTGYYGITEEDAKWLRRIVRFMAADSDLIRYDVKDLYLEHLDGSVNRSTGFTPYAGLRLLADLILDVDCCMYLDADIIVQGDLRPPYERCRRAGSDYAAYTIPDACDGFGELISAVLVLNLRNIRQRLSGPGAAVLQPGALHLSGPDGAGGGGGPGAAGGDLQLHEGPQAGRVPAGGPSFLQQQ